MAAWRTTLAGRGQSLEVLNPKSLLAQVLPVHRTAPQTSG
jgi:hypothetical protein